MIFGILDIHYPDGSIDIVRCNMCYAYYYDTVFFDTRDESVLQIVWDEDDDEFVRGCGNCQTDAYLIDIEREQLSGLKVTPNVLHI